MVYEELNGSMPCYKKGEGNGCMLILRDKLEWWPQSEKSCLHRWAKHYCVDLHELRKRTKKTLGKAKYYPLVLHEDCTLIPYNLHSRKV